jgi:hypothetical protein
MLPIEIGTVTIDHVTLICPQLLTQAIIGVDLFNCYDAVISFPERCVFMKINDEILSHRSEDEWGLHQPKLAVPYLDILTEKFAVRHFFLQHQITIAYLPVSLKYNRVIKKVRS